MSALVREVRLTPITSARSGIDCGHVIVEIDAGDGLVGIGEMSDFQHLPMYHVDVAGLARTLNALLVGRDPRQHARIDGLLDEVLPMVDSLYDKTSVIRCGIDIALWDLRARMLDASVSELLGGTVRDALPIAYPIFRQQAEGDIERNLERVQTMIDRGFRRFRVYVGRSFVWDESFLRACRERFGDAIGIKSLDFSNLADAADAAAFVERTRDVGYEFVEAPARAGDLAGLRFVRERTLVPVSEHAYGLRSALDLVSSGAVDILNVGLFTLGGISGALRALAVAKASGVRALIGTTQELAIGTAAAVHVGAADATVDTACDPVGPLLYERDVVSDGLRFGDSSVAVPVGPGLGVEISPGLLAAARHELGWDDLEPAVVIDRTGGRGAQR